jgi:predicted  nucleic acid-binding Zn-ribbon protein
MTDQHDSLAALLALQDTDLHVDQLTHQIEHHPLSAAEHAATVKQAAIAKRVSVIESGAAAPRQRQRDIEREIEASDARARVIEERMRSAASGSFRDQGAMALEVESLSRRKHELEDEELVIMEELEPVDVELSTLAAENAALALELEHLGAELGSATAELRVARDELRSTRSALAGAVPDELLVEYERLRARLGGIGAARVVRGACSGCNLALSSTELDHLRHAPADVISHCEQCGRILVLQ